MQCRIKMIATILLKVLTEIDQTFDQRKSDVAIVLLSRDMMKAEKPSSLSKGLHFSHLQKQNVLGVKLDFSPLLYNPFVFIYSQCKYSKEMLSTAIQQVCFLPSLKGRCHSYAVILYSYPFWFLVIFLLLCPFHGSMLLDVKFSTSSLRFLRISISSCLIGSRT